VLKLYLEKHKLRKYRRTWSAKVSVKVVFGKSINCRSYRRTWNAKGSIKVVFGKA